MTGEEVKSRINLLMQEKEKQKRLDVLRHDTLRKIEFLSKKTLIEQHDVYQLIREFFKEFLEKRYEFTFKELRAELKKVYISNSTRTLISTMLESIDASEYVTVHYTRADLVKILDMLREIVQQLVSVHTSKKSLVEHLKSFLFKDPDPQTIIAELPVIEGNDAYHIRIYTLIEKCYVAMDKHNLRRAQSAYEALLSEYGILDDGLKMQYYGIIQQTYQDLLHRAEMLKKKKVG